MEGEIWMQQRRALPMNGLMMPEQFGQGGGIRGLPPRALHPYETPTERMDKQMGNQNGEMERLAAENQRLASTHGTLRRELAASQHELQMLQGEIGSIRSEREQRMVGLVEKMEKLEAELQSSETIHLQLQQSRAEAQGLAVARQELLSNVQLMTQDLQRAHLDSQQIPALISELEGLRQEYQNCRSTYDYEKKVYNDHLDSLQVMEKKYVAMAREVEKLRAELTNSTGAIERRSATGGGFGHGEERISMSQNNQNRPYEDDYAAVKGRGSHQGGGPVMGGGQATPAAAAAAVAQSRMGYDTSGRGGLAAFDVQHMAHVNMVPTSGATGYPMAGPAGGGGPANVMMPHGSANPRPPMQKR